MNQKQATRTFRMSPELMEPLKIGFVAKMSEMVYGKEAGENSRKRMKTYVEDNFLPPTKSEAISNIYSRNRIFRGSIKAVVVMVWAMIL